MPAIDLPEDRRTRLAGLAGQSALLLAAGLVLACGLPPPSSPSSPPPAPPPAAASLLPGSPLEREIEAGETQSYDLEVAAAPQFLRLSVRPNGSDVGLRLIAPDGSELAAADADPGFWKEEHLLAIAPVAGRYRLEVTSRRRGQLPGRYRVEVQEQRSVQADDSDRLLMDRLLAEGLKLKDQDSEEALGLATAKLGQALELARRTGEEEAVELCLGGLGLLSRQRGDVKQAVAYYLEGLALAEKTGHRRREASLSNNLAFAYKVQGQAQEAAQRFARALELWHEIGDLEEEARILNNLGFLYLDLGETEKALDAYQKALPLRRLAGDLRGESITLNGIGAIYLWNFGEIDKALDYFQQALHICRSLSAPACAAAVLNNLAGIHRRRGEPEKALELYGEALQLHRSSGDRESEAKVLNAQGTLYLELGDFEKALDTNRRALELYRAVGNAEWEARALADIAGTRQFLGDDDAAWNEYRQALEINRGVGSSRIEAQALQGLAEIDLRRGRFADSLGRFEAALALRRKNHDRFGEASSLLGLGSAYRDSGEPGKARDCFEQALVIAREAEVGRYASESLLQLARLNREGGALEAARSELEEALAMTESLRNRVASRQLRTTLLASRRAYYESYTDLLLRLAAREPGRGYEEQALAASERARARGLLDLLAEGKVDVEQGIDPELKRREREIERQLASAQNRLIEVLSVASPSAADLTRASALRAELARAEEQREQLEGEIRRRHPRYAEILYPQPSGLAEIQGLLDGDSALLEYALGEERSFLFVVTRESLTVHPLPAARELAQQVARLREAIVEPGRRLAFQYTRTAGELYRQLVAPAGAVLAAKSRLLIVPDGPLQLLPFEALLTSEGFSGSDWSRLPYLIRDKAISYVPSASVLASLRRPGKREEPATGAPAKKFLAFADPVYSRSEAESAPAEMQEAATRSGDPLARWSLARLAESGREVREIAGLYPPDEVALYLRESANERNVKLNPLLGTAERVHFAAHGFLDERWPELSGLVLSRAGEAPGESPDDGILRVYEIFNLRLAANLVVLSSCESGLGKEVRGEGLVGLSRAFLYAGTPSLVVSLWEVRDTSTADLMVDFYRQLDRPGPSGQGGGKVEALRRSKLEMIAAGRFAHPAHWASFVLMGEAR